MKCYFYVLYRLEELKACFNNISQTLDWQMIQVSIQTSSTLQQGLISQQNLSSQLVSDKAICSSIVKQAQVEVGMGQPPLYLVKAVYFKYHLGPPPDPFPPPPRPQPISFCYQNLGNKNYKLLCVTTPSFVMKKQDNKSFNSNIR